MHKGFYIVWKSEVLQEFGDFPNMEYLIRLLHVILCPDANLLR